MRYLLLLILVAVLIVPAIGQPCCDAPACNVDCILAVYNDAGQQLAEREGKRLALKYHGDRVVTYPDFCVPVLVPKRLLPTLKKQLGPEMLILSPDLQ
jgi:hypothetical protein